MSAAVFQANAEIINKRLATVGDTIITQYDVDAYAPLELRKIYSITDIEERTEKLKKHRSQVLEILVNQNVIEEAAKKLGIHVTDRDVDLAVEDFAGKNNVTKEQFYELLEKNSTPVPQYRLRLKNDLIKLQLQSYLVKRKIIITNHDIQKYIRERGEEMNLTDKSKLRVLAVENKEQLEEALNYFKETKDFIAAVNKYSKEESTKANGGDIGWLELIYADMRISTAVVVKNKGEVTRPVNLDDGLIRVYYIEDQKDKEDIDEQTKKDIITNLTVEMMEKVFTEWVERNKQEIFIQYAN